MALVIPIGWISLVVIRGSHWRELALEAPALHIQTATRCPPRPRFQGRSSPWPRAARSSARIVPVGPSATIRPSSMMTVRGKTSRDQAHVVGGDEHRLRQAAQDADQLAPAARIEAGRRLVEDEHARVHRQHRGQRDALALAELS